MYEVRRGSVSGIQTRYDHLIERLREAAQPDRPEPLVAQAYLEKVRRTAYAITDRDVAELEKSGLSDHEIFEQTIAAAVGVGLARLNTGLQALG
jgi:alkylhydroperoxidase family enzyme